MVEKEKETELAAGQAACRAGEADPLRATVGSSTIANAARGKMYIPPVISICRTIGRHHAIQPVPSGGLLVHDPLTVSNNPSRGMGINEARRQVF